MPKVDKTPELVGVADADLLSPPSVPVLAVNLTLKLPVFWPKAAKVWFAQADVQSIRHQNHHCIQDQVLTRGG